MQSNEQFFNKLLHDAQMRVARGRLGKASSRPSNVFVEPSSHQWIEHHRRFRPEGYYRLHCSHDKPLWEVCSSQTCRRGKHEANANMVKFLSGMLK